MHQVPKTDVSVKTLVIRVGLSGGITQGFGPTPLNGQLTD